MDRRRQIVRRSAWAAALLLGIGCGPTQVSRANRDLVESLATAVSARNAGWLAENVRQIETRRADGRLPEAEAAAFRGIVERAEAGDWAGAESLAFNLRDGQRPSGEDYASPERPKLREPRQYEGMPRRSGPKPATAPDAGGSSR